MMALPGEQFTIRRKAYAMIKKAFDEDRIKFAFPTVQVAKREEAEPAAARAKGRSISFAADGRHPRSDSDPRASLSLEARPSFSNVAR
jgi:hypothetical protein